ncbi:MAG TPA: Fe-S-binding domain-containing protein [Deltaproteobacteria bacterium]|nr:Fe-S-binding domain-containing protein [Deltaproteobacteria bacterium]
MIMMNWIGQHILTLIIFLPLGGALLSLLIPREKTAWLRLWALLVSLVTFVLSLHLVYHFENGAAHQFSELYSWIPNLGIRYHVAIDGFSLWLILLTTLLMPLSILFSMSSIHEREKSYYFFLLALESGMIGAFCALDLFLFYLFWEGMLIPMYFLIGSFGGKRRIYAAVKFFLFTMVGSVLMLLAMIYLYYQADGSFALERWLDLPLSPHAQLILFAAFALSFAIKVPMFPLHTWLPDAHVEAPTAGSVILAGVLLKMGTYGFVRFAMPLFPQGLESARPLLVTLAVVGIIYGALVAMVQKDVKKLVAYSSISHLGFVMLGLMAMTPQAVTGAVYQMLNHGISTGGLFLIVGMLYDRTHTRAISDYGGIAKQVPILTSAFLVIAFSSIALPGTNGFVGEFLILSGSFGELPWATFLSTSAVIFAAVYMLWMIERVCFGPMKNPQLKELKDLSRREALCLAPILLLIVWMGIRPNVFLQKIEPATQALLERVAEPLPAKVGGRLP